MRRPFEVFGGSDEDARCKDDIASVTMKAASETPLQAGFLKRRGMPINVVARETDGVGTRER